MSKGDSNKKLMVNMYDIKDDKDTNLLPENIRKNTKILGVTGTLDPQADESDATATSSDIALNKSAYVNNEKIYGSVVTTDDGFDTITADIGTNNVTVKTNQIEIEAPIVTNQNVLIRQNSQVSVEGTIDNSIIANKANITGDKILEGNTILGVEGTYVPLDTSDANATSNDIIGSDKTAYVNGQKITGTPYFIIDGTIFTLTSENVTTSRSNIVINTGDIIGNYVLKNRAKITINVPQTDIANVVNLTPDKIKSGENILGIEGNVIAANLTNLDVIPSINTQSITPNSPYNGFNVVNITAVNANIDPNIISNNIRSGVNILGVTGNVKEGVPVYESEEDLQEVVGSDGDLALVMKNETVKFADFPTSISVGSAQNKTQDRTEYTLTGGREGESGTIIVTSNYSSTIRRYYHFWNIKFTNYLGDVYNIAYSGNKYDTQTVDFPIYITKNGTSFTPSETVSIPTELPIIETLQQATAKPPTTICQYSQKEELKVSGLFRYETNKWNLYFFNVTDATADITDVAYGKVFYKGIDRYVGTLTDVSSSTSSTTGDITLAGSKLYLKRTNDLILRSNSLGIATTYEDLAQAIGLTADKIKKGEIILGITGTYEGEV